MNSFLGAMSTPGSIKRAKTTAQKEPSSSSQEQHSPTVPVSILVKVNDTDAKSLIDQVKESLGLRQTPAVRQPLNIAFAWTPAQINVKEFLQLNEEGLRAIVSHVRFSFLFFSLPTSILKICHRFKGHSASTASWRR